MNILKLGCSLLVVFLQFSCSDLKTLNNYDAIINIVESDNHTMVAEGGVADGYAISLGSAPNYPVTIFFDLDLSQVAVTPSSRQVSFDKNNYNIPQSIDLTAVDDSIIEDPVTLTISHRIVTKDKVYAQASVADISVIVLDNDKIIYVSDAVAVGGNGTSWANAYRYLSTALENALPGREIWVKSGTHYPNMGTPPVDNREQTFLVNQNVTIYGGFTGNEVYFSGRDPVANVTILSGDLDQNDTTPASFGNYDNNAYHVVHLQNVTSATISGFTIEAGKANGGSANQDRGAGVFLENSTGVAFKDIIIRYNDGNGIYVDATSSADVYGATFTGNNDNAVEGAAIANASSNQVVCSQCTFNSQVDTPLLGRFRMYGITFSGNTGTLGAASFTNGSSEVHSVHLSSNLQAMLSVSPLTLVDIDFSNHTFNGTAIDLDAGAVNVTRGNFENNNGPGAAFTGLSVLQTLNVNIPVQIRLSRFYMNYGGVLSPALNSNSTGQHDFIDSHFESNSSDGNFESGGVISTQNGSVINSTRNLFLNNSTNQWNGVIRIGAPYNETGSIYYNNSAANYGGAFRTLSSVTIHSATFVANWATNQGDTIYGSSMSVYNSIFIGKGSSTNAIIYETGNSDYYNTVIENGVASNGLVTGGSTDYYTNGVVAGGPLTLAPGFVNGTSIFHLCHSSLPSCSATTSAVAAMADTNSLSADFFNNSRGANPHDLGALEIGDVPYELPETIMTLDEANSGGKSFNLPVGSATVFDASQVAVNQVGSTVTVTPVDDCNFEPWYRTYILLTNGGNQVRIPVNMLDNDMPSTKCLGVYSSGNTDAVTEGGANDDYYLSLTAKPTANVVVTLSASSQLTVDKSSVTFTPENWAVPQLISVTAVDDGDTEGTHYGLVSHSLASSDASFQGLPVRSFMAEITDND